MTETAKLADIVLPATMFLEHDDVYQAGGHPHIQIGTQVIEPPGECRSNHEVLCGLAKRLGAQHRGFEMSAWQMIDETLKASGWPGADEIQAKHWHDVIGDFETSHFLQGLPDQRRPLPLRAGLGEVRPPSRRHAEAARPFRHRREGRCRASVPAGGRAGAPVPQHVIHGDADGAQTRSPADVAAAPARRGVAGRGRRHARAHRQSPRRDRAACQAVRRAAARRGGGGEHLAQRRFQRRHRHQRPDRRRSRPAQWRRGLP